MLPLNALSDRWPALSPLLDEALALPAPERAAWLASLAGERAELKDTLRELLAAHAGVETGDFLSTLPKLHGAGGAAASSGELSAGLMVGPYRLIAELGQGGMGAVWLAERADGQLKRKVALKLPRLVWGGGLAERLARERDILASLAHANIARLYDAGLDQQGRPYLAMEYVEGQPIDVHCRDTALPLRARIGQLLQVCEAVAHAHARLVVHRDLKPSNILVTADGQVRLLDFGIAKLLTEDMTAAETALTLNLGRALTPDYASPEQIRGAPLSTASDVYSLGVVAYELMAGSLPYRLKRGSAAELEEAIASADPPSASDTAQDAVQRKRLRGDLDAILNKALKKRPDERYASVTALADDLRRHLDGHPVLARPDSRWYTARKFVARNRVPVAAATAMFAALGIGLSVALWQNATARENLRRATMALEREDGVRRLLVESLAGVSALDAKTFAEPGSVSRLLQAKLAELEELYRDQPFQRLSLLNTVATQLPYFGDYAGSLAAWQRYLPLLRAQRGEAQQLLEGYIGASRALYFLRRFAEQEAMAREGLDATAAAVGVAETRAELAYQLADALQRRGARTESSTLLDEHERAVQASENPQHKVHWDIQMLRARMALDYDDFESLRLSQQAQAGYAGNADSSKSQLGMSAQYVGLAHAALGQLAQAELAFKTGLQLYETIFSREDRDTVQALTRLARAIATQGRYDEARQMLAERRREVEAKPGPDTPLALRMLLTRQLELALMHGDLAAAAGLVESVRTSHAQTSVDQGPIFTAEARWHLLAGRPEATSATLAAWLAKLPPERATEPQALRARLMHAEAQIALGHQDRAQPMLTGLLQDMRRIGATRNWTYRQALELAALTAASQGKGVESWASLEQFERESGVAMIEPPSQADKAESLLRRANVLRAAGQAAQAAALEPLLRAALQAQHAASPRHAWRTATP